MNRQIAPEIKTPSSLPQFNFNISTHDSLKIIESSSTSSLCRINLVFAHGSKHDTRFGLSHFTLKLLLSGTKNKTANAIQEQLDLFGAYLETEVLQEQSIVSLFVLEKHLENAFFYLIDCFKELLIPEEEWELFKRRSLENLKISQRKTSFRVKNLHSSTYFGSDHPYGRSQNESSFDNIESGFLTNYFQAKIFPNLSTVYANCDLSQNIISALKEISRETSKQLKVSFPVKLNSETRVSVKVDESVQSSLILTLPAIGRTDPDYPAFSIANTLFGGFFGSRLMKNIREDKGYTYGISSGIQHFQEGSLLNIRTDMDHQYVDKAIDEIKQEISRLVSEPIAFAELDLVKKYMMGSLQRSFDGPLLMLDRYKTLLDFNLSSNYYHQYIQSVLACTVEDVTKVVQRYYTSPLLIVIAGKE